MKEAFVSQEENDDIVKEVFIIFGYSVASIIIVVALAWGYYNNLNIFIAVYSLIIILYNVMIISIVVMNKNIYDSSSYTIIFGTTIFSIFLTFFVGMFFLYKFFTLPIKAIGTSATAAAAAAAQDVNYSYKY
jgi:hypothetical protein